MKQLIVFCLLCVNLSAVSATTHRFSTNLLTEITTATDEKITAEVIELDDVDNCSDSFPVGSRIDFRVDEHIPGKFLSDEKLHATITQVTLPDDSVQQINKSITIKPRSFTSRVLIPFVGLVPEDLPSPLKGQEMVIFDVAHPEDNTRTAVVEPLFFN